MPEDTTHGPAVPSEVRAHLVASLGSDAITITEARAVRLPTGGSVRAFHAAVDGKPNVVTAVTIDDAGELRPLARLVEDLGHNPFVPDFTAVRTGPEPAPREPVTIDPTSNDWRLSECERARETITVTVPPTGVAAKADVYLLADTTGSMSSILDAVKAGAASILGDPALGAFDVAWGVGNYRDFPVPGTNSYAFQHQLSPTTDHTQADLAIGAWSANEGGDTSEGQFFALHELATSAGIGWRTDSKRIVVWFGDAPGHDPICTDLSGLASAVTEASVTAELTGAQITVVAVSTTTGPANALDDDPQADAGDYVTCPGSGTPGQASRISAATGGSHTTGVDPTTIVGTLSVLIAAAVASTGNVKLVPSASIEPFVESITPAGGYGPLTGNEEHVLTFEVVWVGSRPCRDKDQVFTGTIDVVADGVVVAAKRVRVTVPRCRYHYSVEVVCGDQPPKRSSADDHGSHEDGPGDDHEDPDDKGVACAVVAGRYATAVTIYNPSTCTAVIEKRFAPLVLHGRTIGREPDQVPAKPFAKLELEAGHATMDDCCALEEAVGAGSGLVVGVLDIVSDRPLSVSAVHTARELGGKPGGPAITTRTIVPLMAP
jgi:hypothetical protein